MPLVNPQATLRMPAVGVSLFYHAVRTVVVMLHDLHVTGHSKFSIRRAWPTPDIHQLEKAADKFCSTPLRSDLNA